MERDYNLEKRKYVIGASVIVIVLIYLIRLFTLQIMSEDYKKNADSNAFLNKTQYPSRGVMYDRNGNLLVYNQPAYDVTMVMKEVHNLDTLDLCKTLNITPDYFKKRIREIKDRRSNPGYSPYTHQVFMTQLSAEECGVFQEKLFKFPGFYIQRRTIRQYNYNAAAHVLGDIAEVSKAAYRNLAGRNEAEHECQQRTAETQTADEPHQSVAFAADAERARGLFHIVTQIDGAAEHQQIHDEVKQYGEL